jgi:polyphosphate kinase
VRSGLVERIEREIEVEQAAPGTGYVGFKMNSIVDEQIIDSLYRASQAGVRVQLWVRGICALRPGVPRLSENIEVRSVLGRFLEHSRIYCFGGGGEPEAFIGSADMMHRNLDRRVEALAQITDPRHLEQLRDLIERGMSDDYAHWRLSEDGRWTRHHLDDDGQPLADLQATLIETHAKRRRKARRA